MAVASVIFDSMHLRGKYINISRYISKNQWARAQKNDIVNLTVW